MESTQKIELAKLKAVCEGLQLDKKGPKDAICQKICEFLIAPYKVDTPTDDEEDEEDDDDEVEEGNYNLTKIEISHKLLCVSFLLIQMNRRGGSRTRTREAQTEGSWCSQCRFKNWSTTSINGWTWKG